MAITIVPEALEMIKFYNSRLSRKDAVKAVRSQVEKTGRFDLNVIKSEESQRRTADNLYRRAQDKLKMIQERDFIQRVLSSDLNKVIEMGLKRAKTVFYEKDKFKEPIVFFTAGMTSTNAKTLEDNSFGISLSQISYDPICRKDATLLIENLCAHEGNHNYIDQLLLERNETDIGKAKEKIFREGLATFVMSEDVLKQSETHVEYMKNVKEWEGYMERVFKSNKEDRLALLGNMINSSSFKRLRPKAAEELKATLESSDKIDVQKYEAFLKKIFLESNGPAYTIGYNMLSKINEKYGIEKVRDVVSKGPSELFAVYKSI
ncbi:MAG: DUF5700 domain-containing putative Zn-dependent protease [Candidatus Aenigmatarchaeota archaeon]